MLNCRLSTIKNIANTVKKRLNKTSLKTIIPESEIKPRKKILKINKKLVPFLAGLLLVFLPILVIQFTKPPKTKVNADSLLKLDEGYGTQIKDSVGTTVGTITGATWKAEDLCFSGKCLYFDGSDWINFGDVAAYDFAASTDFTIEFWFRHGPATSAEVIFQKYESVGGDGGFRIQMESDGDISFGVDDANGNFADDSITSTAGTYDDNKWHFVSAVKDGTTGIYLYIDGAQVASDTNIGSNGPLANNDTFFIGDSRGSNGGDEFIGYLDEIKIYTSSARSYDEIKTDLLGHSTNNGTTASFGADQKSTSDGLVGYWRMDESTWGTPDCSSYVVIDSTGSNNNGKACPVTSGPTGSGVGKFDLGGSFDGGDYVDIANSDSLNISGSITLNLWIYSTATGTQYILDKKGGTLGTAESGGYMFGISSVEATGLSFTVSDGTTASRLNSGTDNEIRGQSKWGMATLVYNEEEKMQYIYVNGELKASQSANIGKINTTTAMRFGTGVTTLSYFTGNMDEIKIYNRALSSNEVKNLYNWAPGPLGYWKLDEGSGTVVGDSSGNGINGTENSPYWDWTNGKFGNAIMGNGTDGYIQLTNGASVKNAYEFTVEAWVYPTAIPPNGARDYFYSETDSASINAGRATFGIWNGVSGCGAGVFAGYVRTVGYGTMYLCGTQLVQTNQWYHVAIVVNTNTDTHQIFVNGMLDKTHTIDFPRMDSGDPLLIPAIGNWSSGGNQAWNGKIDEVKIYRYARTPAQILEDMNIADNQTSSAIKDPLVHWKFDEGYGDTANNSGISGSALNADLAGAATTCPTTGACPTWTSDGKYGKALEFDGSDDYVNAGSDPELDDVFAFGGTYSLWMKMDSYGEGSYGRLIQKGDYGGTRTGLIVCDGEAVSCNNNLRFYRQFSNDANTGNWNSAANSLSTGVWYHVAVTYDERLTTNDPIFYINGVRSPATETATPNGTAVSDASVDMWIGNRNYLSGDRTFDGIIDDIRIYRHILTDDEILQIYNQGVSTSLGSISTDSQGNVSDSSTDSYCPPGQNTACVGPVAEWKFDEKSGGYANDTSGNNNRGTLISGPKWTAQGKCRMGACLYFDGASGAAQDDRVNVAASTSIDNLSQMTMSAWIYPQGLGENNRGRIFNKTSGTSLNSRAVNVYDNNSISFTHGWSTSTNQYASWHSPDNSLTLNQWNHVTVTYDNTSSSNDPEIYINGAKQEITEVTAPSGTVGDESGGAMDIGNMGSSRTFDGYIDELKYYNYIRTPSQIAWDYNRGKPLAWYKFDECTGATANDSSKNGHTATIYPGNTDGDNDSTGTCGSGDTHEMWNDGTIGKRNSGLGFDGINDYAATNSSIDLTGASTITTTFWMYWDAFSDNDDLAFESSVNFNTNNGAVLFDPNTGFPCPGYLGVSLRNQDTRAETYKRPTAGEWHHYVAIYDLSVATGEITLYIDGKLQESVGFCSGGWESVTTGNFGNYNWYFMSRAGTGLFGAGKMDDFKIFNYGLTKEQIELEYNEGAVSFR